MRTTAVLALITLLLTAGSRPAIGDSLPGPFSSFGDFELHAGGDTKVIQWTDETAYSDSKTVEGTTTEVTEYDSNGNPISSVDIYHKVVADISVDQFSFKLRATGTNSSPSTSQYLGVASFSGEVHFQDSMQVLNAPSLELLGTTFWWVIEGNLQTGTDTLNPDYSSKIDLNANFFTGLEVRPFEAVLPKGSSVPLSLLVGVRAEYDSSNRIENFGYDLGAVALKVFDIQIGNTVRLDSITFDDGTTPEEHGYELSFASGFTSPNITNVPEPSAFALGAFGLLGFAFYGCRRRRKLAAQHSAAADHTRPPFCACGDAATLCTHGCK